jgi:hypothetical protein
LLISDKLAASTNPLPLWPFVHLGSVIRRAIELRDDDVRVVPGDFAALGGKVLRPRVRVCVFSGASLL